MVNWTAWCMWLYNVNIHVTLRVKAKEIEPVYRWVNNVDLTLTSFQSPCVRLQRLEKLTGKEVSGPVLDQFNIGLCQCGETNQRGERRETRRQRDKSGKWQQSVSSTCWWDAATIKTDKSINVTGLKIKGIGDCWSFSNVSRHLTNLIAIVFLGSFHFSLGTAGSGWGTKYWAA